MNIGDDVLIRAKVVGLNAGPYGAVVKIEITGRVDRSEYFGPLMNTVQILINQSDQPKVIVGNLDTEIIDQSVILNSR